jgi:uncharacterized protein YggU (UPF0235/DUF167 family)
VPDVFRPVPGGVDIFIRLTPGARREGMGGVFAAPDRSWLMATVRAVPEDGKANRALLELLADTLSVPRSTLSLASGETARLKTVRLMAEGQALDRAIAALRERTK